MYNTQWNTGQRYGLCFQIIIFFDDFYNAIQPPQGLLCCAFQIAFLLTRGVKSELFELLQ